MTENPTAILFPGQGSQGHGMGRMLAEADQSAMELWKKGEKISGFPLRSIYWESEDEGLMAETQHLQPAVSIVNLALWLRLKPRLTPWAAAGHSLGEFSALGAAEVLGIEKIIELTSLRGRLMSQADPEGIGTMYAILRLGLKEVEAIAKDVSERTGKLMRVANHNTPGQFAVSGHREAMEELLDAVREAKGKAIALAVSGAFHTPLMAEAAAEFSKMLDKQDWRDPKFPIYCNVTGEKQDSGEKLRTLVRRQMTSSVLWIDVITNQYQDGVRRWVEFGPKGILTRMVRPILTARHIPDSDYNAEHIPNYLAADAFIG